MDAEVSLPLRHALDGQLNLVLFQVLGCQVKFDLSQTRLFAEFLHLDVRKVLALQELLLHCVLHGSDGLAEDFGCLEQLLACVLQFAVLHLRDVVTESVNHHMCGVAHRADVLGVSIARDDGL